MAAKTFEEILKFNPYHDAKGRFSNSDGYATFTYAPGKSKAHDLAIQREKDRNAANSGGSSSVHSPKPGKITYESDDFGKPGTYVVYRNGGIGKSGMLFFAPKKETADSYASSHGDGNTTEYEVKIKNPLVIDGVSDAQCVSQAYRTLNPDKPMSGPMTSSKWVRADKANAAKIGDGKEYDAIIYKVNGKPQEVLIPAKSASTLNKTGEYTTTKWSRLGWTMQEAKTRGIYDRDPQDYQKVGVNKSAQDGDSFSIFKTDDDKRLVFGWASVSITVDGEQLEDRQKDIIDPEDLEEAAYEYVLNFRDTGEEHISSMRKKGKLVESCVFTAEKQKAIGIPEGILPIGWWIGFKIEDEAAWERVKNGTYKMFSIEGKANRIPVEKSQLKGCGVLVVQDGKILAGTRIERGGKGKLCGPGGHIEPGETPEEAAKREAWEEFGITCEELTPLGTLKDGSSAIFLCTKFSGTPETDEEGMTEPTWLTIEELQEADLFGPFEASLEKLSPAKRHSVAKTFDEILKANPHHDSLGRFTSAGAAGTAKGTIDGLAAKTAKNMSAYEDKRFVKQLTPAEGEAAAAYTEEIGFEMNKMARGQAIDEEHYDYDEVLDHALNLESALSKAKLPQDAAVFRGASFDTAVDSTGLSQKEIQADPQKLVGKTITELGFMSTTTDAGLAEEYADGMVYHIKLPAGSQAVLQNTLNENLDGPEITVNRNSKFRVLAAENKGGNTHAYMEYIQTGNSTKKSAPVAKTFDEVLKFNPFHDAKGRFASSNSFASYSANPKTKAGAMAISRSAQAGHGYTFNSHKESQGENINQNYQWLNGGPGAKQLAAQGQLASQQPKTPPKPQKNYDARGFADQDDATFHQLHSGKKYYAQQQLTTQEQNAAANYLSANPEPGSLYSHCQNMNYMMATGQTLTGQYKKTHDGMMSAMHNMGYNVELTRYDHAAMVNGLLRSVGAGTNYERMSQSSLKKALVGQSVSENKFLSASYNDFANAPNSSVFTSRAVKINYKVRANAQAMMPGKGPGGDFGEIVLAPTNGKANPPGRITDVRLTGQMMRRQGTQTYNQPRIEIDIEIG